MALLPCSQSYFENGWTECSFVGQGGSVRGVGTSAYEGEDNWNGGIISPSQEKDVLQLGGSSTPRVFYDGIIAEVCMTQSNELGTDGHPGVLLDTDNHFMCIQSVAGSHETTCPNTIEGPNGVYGLGGVNPASHCT